MKVAVLCGGPSLERGISLNSARSFCDHIDFLNLEVIVIYFDPDCRAYLISKEHLYSNTPSDFDFKLNEIGQFLDRQHWIAQLKKAAITFPLIHGEFGEGGMLQALLEEEGIAFVGSKKEACHLCFDKARARGALQKWGYSTPAFDLFSTAEEGIAKWHAQGQGAMVIKPVASGSSIGVLLVTDPNVIAPHLEKYCFEKWMIEPYMEGSEFTVCVLQNKNQEPVALLPIEIELPKGEVLDYRKKYLPTNQTRCHLPARFSKEQIKEIQKKAEELFTLFGMRDFARLDGWILEDGTIYFSDFNPISGLEQNSFIFEQAAAIGMAHGDLLAYILKIAPRQIEKLHPRFLSIVMGGSSAERQVSVMSGTNVWLKLRLHPHFNCRLFLLEKENLLWEVPYHYALYHTAEEIADHCFADRLSLFYQEIADIRARLHLEPWRPQPPRRMDLISLIEQIQNEKGYFFIALHGGMGENGLLQKMLEEANIPFNGSLSETSSLCMDKHRTALMIKAAGVEEICAIDQIPFDLPENGVSIDPLARLLWLKALQLFGSVDLLVKPRCDGCSAGIVHLFSVEELIAYLHGVVDGKDRLGPGLFRYHPGFIEMPVRPTQFLLEPFIETDHLEVRGVQLYHTKRSELCEMTITVLEKEGKYQALLPSITVAQADILSVEEKFQGGSGINITPPPETILSLEICRSVQKKAETIASILKIRGYARLDLFVECKTGRVILIEANTLPALTPSTVLFHQALASCGYHPQHFLGVISVDGSIPLAAR